MVNPKSKQDKLVRRVNPYKTVKRSKMIYSWTDLSLRTKTDYRNPCYSSNRFSARIYDPITGMIIISCFVVLTVDVIIHFKLA